MLLILPVFLTIVFTIMEMGYLAFWVIVLNHATYECARVGSMISVDADGNLTDVTGRLQGYMNRIIPGATVSSTSQNPYYDPQARITNYDLAVTAVYNVPLVFPISSLLLATPPGSGYRALQATVYMPIEHPLPQ